MDMVPTLILVGLLGGLLVPGGRPGLLPAAGVAAALAWGVGVGVIAGSTATFAGGLVIGAANFFFGAIFGIALRCTLGAASQRLHRPRS
jgi:hypothetical protein